MQTFDTAAIAAFVLTEFATLVQVDAAWLRDANPQLLDIMAASDALVNSVDLMEAFARVGVMLRREYGVRVRLPAMALDTPFSDVVAALVAELASHADQAA